ncbi:hypothetical protein HSX11_22370 [Oxalobacteraceae bacterium]|nr:hypothetical protein [Oxalobacteraceae bacterium]
MIAAAAWLLAVLGGAHALLGLIWFRQPIRAALREGGIGQFQGHDARRVAFWFTIFGPLLLCLGHVAIRAVAAADFALINIIGCYLLGLAIVALLALPKSGFWAILLLAPVFIGAGRYW